MYAVIETGGKQYRVEVGTELEVELLDVEPGKTITLDRILLVADGDTSAIGRPVVENASVSAEVVTQTRGPKLIAFKYRPKARSRVKKGHRQELTVLRISDIVLAGKSAAEADGKAKAAAKTERQKLADAAEVQAAKDAELAAKLAVGTEAAEPKAKATTKAEKPAKADADAKPAAKPAAKAEADAKPAAKAEAAAKATTAKSTAKPADAKPAAKAAPKTTAKAAAAETTEAPAKAPKKAPATKKDE
jgi:large subunit ribosomal protein L21